MFDQLEIFNLIDKATATHKLDEAEIAAILAADDATEYLVLAADEVRHQAVGDEVHLRGLIEFSNICRNSCLYCGLRRENDRLARYRLTLQEIVDLAKKAVGYGYHTVVLQSGEDMWFTAPRLADIIREIKKLDLAVTLSVGERETADYAEWREAGADRFLLRIETTDRVLYDRYHPGQSHDRRFECLKNLKSLGYEVGTGCLVGLPGQTLEMLARDLLYFQVLDADMVGIGPLIPNADTPLKDAIAGDYRLTRRLLSLIRLLIPTANIPATTAMETLRPGSRWELLQSGANVIMPNVTEGEARKNYALYPGKACVSDTPANCSNCLRMNIARIGRTISQGKGFRRK